MNEAPDYYYNGYPYRAPGQRERVREAVRERLQERQSGQPSARASQSQPVA